MEAIWKPDALIISRLGVALIATQAHWTRSEIVLHALQCPRRQRRQSLSLPAPELGPLHGEQRCSFATTTDVQAAATSGKTCGALRVTTTARSAAPVTCLPTKVKTWATRRMTTANKHLQCSRLRTLQGWGPHPYWTGGPTGRGVFLGTLQICRSKKPSVSRK